MKPFYVVSIVALLVLTNSPLIKCSRDLANQKGASGSQVVEHAVDAVTGTCILDNGLFLRRMAYAETRDGTNAGTYRAGYHGGIWNIDEGMFKRTQNQPGLKADYDAIKQNLFIDWSKVTWEDLRAPLKSAIAATLYIRSLNIRTIPDDIAIQSAIWGTLRPANSAGTFFLDSTAIQRDCTPSGKLDLIIALDFAHLSSVDLARVQMFLEAFVKSFSPSQDTTRIGLVTKKLMPTAGWYLNSDRPGFTLLNALKALRFTPGPTFTGDMLEFARQTMFNTSNGARPSAARAVLLLTDGITQYAYAKDEANNFAENGISLAIIEVDVNGTSTSRDQLYGLVSEPGCKHALVVRTFDSLEKNSKSIQESLCNAPTQPEIGLSSYTCSETVNIRIPDISDAFSIQVIPFGISVDIFASKVYSRPNDIGFDAKLTVSTTYNPALFFRGLGHMFVTVKPNDTSSSCSGTFTVLIKKIDTISGANGTCVIGDVVRECTALDMNIAAHDSVLVRDQSSLDLCDHSNHSVEYFPHPTDPHKFIMCDRNEHRFVGLCPSNQTSCMRFTSGCKYTNPCTPEAIANGEHFFSDPCADPQTYVQCSQFGVAEALNCGFNKLWNQNTRACVYKYVHSVMLGIDVGNISNPCLYNHEEHAYFPFPQQPSKYIFCDANGNAFESSCRSGTWNQQTKSCEQSSPQGVPIG